jgi:hypothetical protein
LLHPRPVGPVKKGVKDGKAVTQEHNAHVFLKVSDIAPYADAAVRLPLAALFVLESLANVFNCDAVVATPSFEVLCCLEIHRNPFR